MSDLARLSLEAVVVAVTDDRPRILTVAHPGGRRLPAGAPAADRTLELGMRRLIDEQAGVSVGYVEQLYTFGDRDRPHDVGADGGRLVGVAYLILAREGSTTGEWLDWYHLFPWEDHRSGRPPVLEAVEGLLSDWAAGDDDRTRRLDLAFGRRDSTWDPVRALERYELMYEARLVPEWFVDHESPVPAGLPDGTAMGLDHRRVAAVGLTRLRGKLTYRPVVFELMPDTFTLSHLQRTVEALAGQRLHTQNFRRLVERGGLVEATGLHVTTGGRPAGLFRFRRSVVFERPRVGIV